MLDTLQARTDATTANIPSQKSAASKYPSCARYGTNAPSRRNCARVIKLSAEKAADTS
jgi:hypothetical protein